MIHSIEMYIKLTNDELKMFSTTYGIELMKYECLAAGVKRLNEEVKANNKGFAVSWVSNNSPNEWNFHLKIDLIKLLDRNDVVETDYDLVQMRISDFLIYHFGHSTHYESHVLTRIDYKLDVIVLDGAARELLFHLFKKYTKKYRHKKKINWGKDKDGNPLEYGTSQYHKCQSNEFIIYDKEEERLAKKEQVKSYEQGVIRYELRLKNKHLNTMKTANRGKGRAKKLKNYFSHDLYVEYMTSHIYPIVHKGDYYKIYEAEKIIENSSLTRKKKEALRNFLVTISKGNIDTPKKYGMSAPTYRKYLKELESLNINPILIPKNKKNFPSGFKNPFNL